MGSYWTWWLIILVTVLSLTVTVPFSPLSDRFPLKLGLDLQGGTQLILETQMEGIDPQDRDAALESARRIIEKRVNLYGVSEAVVQSSKIGTQRRILVELPGVKDATTAAELIGKTAQLDFREKVVVEKEASLSGTIYTSDFQSTGLTGADLKRAQVTFGSTGDRAGPQVLIEFTAEGAEKFAEITKRNIGKPLAMFLDEIPISWPPPTVQQEIVGGNAVITGQFTTEEAKNLAIQLNAGALPVPIKILAERHIGPSLGLESVNKSLIAGMIGLVIVAMYMGFYYRLLGVVAVVALSLYTILILAIFRTGLFILPPFTLTLAGIAAFILSIGMAVDANILIFERMKEEMRWGKDKILAFETGFKRAWSSIWASNISSLITAAILYYFGNALVRGFAIALSVGVLVSMFTAVVVTRTFLRLIIKDNG